MSRYHTRLTNTETVNCSPQAMDLNAALLNISDFVHKAIKTNVSMVYNESTNIQAYTPITSSTGLIITLLNLMGSTYFNSSNISSSAPDNNTIIHSINGESLEFKIIKLLCYAIIFIISCVGNSLVCVIVFQRRKMQNVTNYFILNLSLADLAVTCICIPFDIPVQENSYIWPYGSFICKILYPLQTISTFASIFSLTVVSLNRYWAVVYPLRRQMTVHQAKCIISVLWILAICILIPYIMVLKLKPGPSCEEEWPKLQYRKAYTATIFILQYVLPLTIITVAYVRIGTELRRHTSTSGNPTLKDQQIQDAKKVIKMLVIVTVLFAVCVLPNNVMWLWLDFGDADKQYDHFWSLVAISNIILFANSAANPICYTICNESFRREFRRYFRCCCQGRSRLYTSTDVTSGTEYIQCKGINGEPSQKLV